MVACWWYGAREAPRSAQICFTNHIPSKPSKIFFSRLFFQLQFTINTILHWFQVDSVVVRQSHTWQSGPRYFQDPPGTTDSLPYHWLHFPMGHPTSHYRAVTTSLHFPISSPFHAVPGNHPSALCICESVCFVCSFVLFLRVHIQVKSHGICLSLSYST